MRNFLRFTAGFNWGILIVGGIVLLVTPYSGQEFQQKFNAWWGELVDAWLQARDESRTRLITQLENKRKGIRS